jgi:hypothetical protein
MNFTLTYDGDLKANGSVKHKHALRRDFHRQLSRFWETTPFSELKNPLESLTTSIARFRFFPMVSAARNETAELHVLMLRPGMGPGFIVGQGGDIDNRLKTLFDSLRMPKDISEIPSDYQQEEDENPFFCLLEDDILISGLSVSTDRLLEPCDSSSHVKLMVRVQTNTASMIGANMILRLG